MFANASTLQHLEHNYWDRGLSRQHILYLQYIQQNCVIEPKYSGSITHVLSHQSTDILQITLSVASIALSICIIFFPPIKRII